MKQVERLESGSCLDFKDGATGRRRGLWEKVKPGGSSRVWGPATEEVGWPPSEMGRPGRSSLGWEDEEFGWTC